MRDVRPWAVDWKSVIPRKPVNVKAMKLNPVERPRLSWSVPPSKKIITNGNTTAATRRPGSRRNLSMSRAAIAMIAFVSLIARRQDPQICLLERWRFGPQHGQRFVNGTHDLMRRAAV